jgi:hypothetical protein
MQDPKIVITKTTKTGQLAPPGRGPAAGPYSDAFPSASDSASASRGERRSFFTHPAFYGLLLVGAGCFAWSVLSDKRPSVPKAWQGAGANSPAAALHAGIRSAGPGQGDLLRLEWPAHPKAESYIVKFEGVNGFASSPIPVLGNVFLYDLKSDVFALPESFRWSVTAVMADGTQVTTGTANYAIEGQR